MRDRAGDLSAKITQIKVGAGRRMTLALHHGDYPRRTDVEAEGCSYFRGHLDGGPYRLAIEEIGRGSLGDKLPPVEYRLFDIGGQFEVICEKLIVGRVW